jgi:hypothetical protein
MRAFHAALDAARRARGLSWAELAAETNRPLEGTTSIPIHPATLRSMLTKRSEKSESPAGGAGLLISAGQSHRINDSPQNALDFRNSLSQRNSALVNNSATPTSATLAKKRGRSKTASSSNDAILYWWKNDYVDS